MDQLDGMVLTHLSERLFTPERLQGLLAGYMAQTIKGQAGLREKLRQSREARGGGRLCRGRTNGRTLRLSSRRAPFGRGPRQLTCELGRLKPGRVPIHLVSKSGTKCAIPRLVERGRARLAEQLWVLDRRAS